MQGLDRPLFPDVSGQVGGVCLAGFRAGDAKRSDGRDRVAVQAGDVPFDQEHLADVRERQAVGGGQDLDGAGGDPAVASVGGGVGDGYLAPWQRIEGVEQGLPVLLHRKHELAALVTDVVRGGFTVCSASAVTILPFRSIWPSTTAAIGISLVFTPTSAWAATTEAAASGPTRAASRRTWFPPASLGP